MRERRMPRRALALLGLAEDTAAYSRVRALACGWLRDRRQPVPAGVLLGVVFEVEVAGGVDVLAVHADGRLRDLNHAGGATLFDAQPAALAPAWRAVTGSARTAAVAARPWPRAGSPRPGPGDARLAFVCSDGPHRRPGRFVDLQRDKPARCCWPAHRRSARSSR